MAIEIEDKTNAIDVEENPEVVLDSPAKEFLTGAHIDTVMRALLAVARRYPAFAAAVNLCTVVDAKIHHDPIDTMAVDAFGHMYINPKFVEGKKPEDLMFAVAHTLLHPMLWHMARQGIREKTRFFNAADRAINLALREMGIHPPTGALMPLKPEHHAYTVEQLYEVEPEPPGESGGGPGATKGQGGPKGKGMQGTKGGRGQGQSDDDDDEDDDNDQQGRGGQGKNPGEGCGMVGPPAPVKDPQAMANAQLRWQMATHYAANSQQNNNAGSTPGRNPLGVLLASPPARVPWGTLIQNVCVDAAACQGRDDVTWSKLHRRSFDSDILLPHPISGYGNVAIVIDSSGSVSDTSLWQAVSEVVSVQNTHPEARIFLVVHDAEVTFAGWLTQVTPATVSRAITGRGGTIFKPAYDRVAEEKTTFHAFVHFTDACPFDPWPAIPDNVKGGRPICALISYAAAQNVPEYLRRVFVELDER